MGWARSGARDVEQVPALSVEADEILTRRRHAMKMRSLMRLIKP